MLLLMIGLVHLSPLAYIGEEVLFVDVKLLMMRVFISSRECSHFLLLFVELCTLCGNNLNSERMFICIASQEIFTYGFWCIHCNCK